MAGARAAIRLARGASAIMAAPDLVNLSGLLDDAKCFAFVRQHRWPEGVRCPGCDSDAVIRNGCDDTQPHRQRYRCKACAGRFDDLTGTVLAGHHQPLRVWVLCLYLMGLNLSNRQIALELKLSQSDAQAMTEQLRPNSCAAVWWPGSRRRGWRARSRSTRCTSWPATKANPRLLLKGALGAATQAEGHTGSGHAGKGQAPNPRPDPARWSGSPAHAGQRAAEDDRAGHHGRRRSRPPHPHRRVWHLRPPGGLGLSAQDGLPCPG